MKTIAALVLAAILLSTLTSCKSSCTIDQGCRTTTPIGWY